jgi:16S rRNA (adenine(1408)-N(1))-methyltransferase
LDIGTGDGRYVLKRAPRDPDKFFIGIDANVQPLEKPSLRLTRKPSKGGASNAMFVQAPVEDLPDEFANIASEIHIQFPWGSLLKAVTTGDSHVLSSLRRIAAESCSLRIVIGIDPARDKSEVDRLGIPALATDTLRSFLIPKYAGVGFKVPEIRILDAKEWSALESTWAKKLQGSRSRTVLSLRFTRT